MKDKSAIVLSSGGLDSTTVLAFAKKAGYRITSLSFDYGQRHRNEISAAIQVAKHMGVDDHRIIRFDLRAVGGSALTDDIPVPGAKDHLVVNRDIPLTYVPARNTIFLSCALAYAEILGAEDIFIGVNAVDYSGYPDCRPEYIAAYEKMANLALKKTITNEMQIRIHTPLIHMSKKEIIQEGIPLGVDYSMTTSCYDPSSDGLACGKCDSCILRQKGFAEAGIPDPTRYAKKTAPE